MARRDILTRFNEKWTPEPYSGCHLWFASTSVKGYGHFLFQRECHQAHRVAWMLYRGEIPEGMCVLHTCDTPSCVCVDHLFLGTNQDNVTDSVMKNRRCIGEDQRLSKLKESDIPKIRADRRPIYRIAKDYGVSAPSISVIKSGKAWRHIN